MGVALVAGLSLVALAYSFADVSGAHFNPSVTFATWLTGKTSNRKSFLFVISQLIGGILAMAAVIGCFGDASDAMNVLTCSPDDSIPNGRIFFTEFMLTFILGNTLLCPRPPPRTILRLRLIRVRWCAVFVVFTVAFETVEDRKRGLTKIKGFANSRGLTLYAANPQSKVCLGSGAGPCGPVRS